jgi:flagellar biosynthesis protein FlhF
VPVCRPCHAVGWDDSFYARLSAVLPGALAADIPAGVLEKMAGLFRIGQPAVGIATNGPLVVVLSGPTGSGKTTTMAKLAAQWGFDSRLKVGLVTLDTYRIGATQQAREYASLLGMEMRVVLSPRDVANAIEVYADKDVVIVDTPGRSHLDARAIGAIKSLLKGFGRIVNLVLVPATMRGSEAADIIASFGTLADSNYLVVTKLDETRDFSVFTTLVSSCEWPIAYLTDGQRVPDDIHAASGLEIAGKVLCWAGNNRKTA